MILKDGKVVATTETDLSFYIERKKHEIEMLNQRIATFQNQKDSIIAELESLAPVKDRPKELADLITEAKPVEVKPVTGPT